MSDCDQDDLKTFLLKRTAFEPASSIPIPGIGCDSRRMSIKKTVVEKQTQIVKCRSSSMINQWLFALQSVLGETDLEINLLLKSDLSFGEGNCEKDVCLFGNL